MAIDYNQTVDAQILSEFTMIFCNADCSVSTGIAQSLAGVPHTLQTANNGVGFSDFLMQGFDLLDDNGGDGFVQFHAVWFNNDGPDRYFLAPGDTPVPSEVPEPSTILLMGSSLLGLAYWRKRSNS